MAFTFLVETGIGLTGATSYVSVAEAEDYFAIDPNAADILAADLEQYLPWASRIIDQKTQWTGSKAVATSGLRWPRSGVYDKDDIRIESNVVPKAVKDATCEVARFLLTYNPASGTGVENLKRIAVDVVEIEYQDGIGQEDWPSIIAEILAPLGTFRSGGMGFAKISRM